MNQTFAWRQFVFRCGGLAVVLVSIGCGSSAPAPTEAPATAAPAAAAPAAPALTLTLLEPTNNVFSGHIDLFRWSAVDGADGYIIRILGSDGRVVYESPVMTELEAHMPKTVAFEPESHTWSVTARKGGEVLATSAVYRFTITP